MTFEDDLKTALAEPAVTVDGDALRAGVQRRFVRRRRRILATAATIAAAGLALGVVALRPAPHRAVVVDARRAPHHRPAFATYLPRERSTDPAQSLVVEAARLYEDDPAAALALLRRVLAEAPSSPHAAEAEVGIGDALFEAKKLDEALQHYDRVPESASLWRYAQYKRGWSYVNLDDRDKAIKAFESAVDGTPNGPADEAIVAASQEELSTLKRD